jgi:hypothetical protein
LTAARAGDQLKLGARTRVIPFSPHLLFIVEFDLVSHLFFQVFTKVRDSP